jgi:hypothetical protein
MEVSRKKILIIAPNYDDKSNGIIILYKLSEYLDEIGYETFFYPIDEKLFNDNKNKYPSKYLRKFVSNIEFEKENAVCILPDAIPFELSKKLNFRWRVWYLLNRPSFLTKQPLFYYENDIFISYSKLVSVFDYQFFLNSPIPEVENIISALKEKKIRKKNQIIVYWGKSRSRNFKVLFLLKILSLGFTKIIPINRRYPVDKKQLYTLISESRLLISFDPLTNLNYEANLCRTPCLIADNYMQIDYRKYNISLLGISDKISEMLDMYYKGISKKDWLRMIDEYKETTQNHLSETKNALAYIFSEFKKVSNLSNAEKIQRIQDRSRYDIHNFEQFKKQMAQVDVRLQEYEPILSFRVLIMHFLLNILKLAIKIMSLSSIFDKKFIYRLNVLIKNEKSLILKRYISSC